MKHFKITDFACKGRHCCGKSHPMNPQLLLAIDELRERIGEPLYVNSGFRCITHNRRTRDASPTSLHMYGLAADITLRKSQEVNEVLYDIAVESGLFSKVIRYGNFVHVDMRGLLDGI